MRIVQTIRIVISVKDEDYEKMDEDTLDAIATGLDDVISAAEVVVQEEVDALFPDHNLHVAGEY